MFFWSKSNSEAGLGGVAGLTDKFQENDFVLDGSLYSTAQVGLGYIRPAHLTPNFRNRGLSLITDDVSTFAEFEPLG